MVVRHKVRLSYISRTVQPRITEVYKNLHAGLVDNHTGYDITIDFRSDVIDVRKTVENVASDGFRWNFARRV